jgi:hypothetical protein
MSERDLYAQQRADAMNREFYGRNQYAADQRMQGRQADAELQARQAMQAQALQAAAAQQASQQAFLGQQAQNARDDEYSQANDPMQRQARERSLDMVAQRQANLIGAQSSANINQNYEGMLDQRALALNKGMIDSALTMQRGNIDSRLLTQQGQQGLIAAGANHGYKVDDDLRQMQMQIEQRNGQMLQTHDFSEGDKKKVESIDQQMSALDDALESGSIDQNQYRQTMGKYLARKSGVAPSAPRTTFDQQVKQRSVTMPDGRIFYDSGKGIAVAPPPPAAAAGKGARTPEDVEREFNAKKADLAQKLLNRTKKVGADDVPYYDSVEQAEQDAAVLLGKQRPQKPDQGPETQEGATQGDPQELFRHVTQVNDWVQRAAKANGVTPQQAFEMLQQKNPEAASMYLQGMQMIRQSQGQPAGDPRAAALQQGRPPMAPPQQMKPGAPGPAVDPRVMQLRQGQPSSVPPEKAPAPTNDQQQTEGALQTLRAIAKKFGGAMPPAGSPEERIAMQAAAFLKKQGIDPTGGVKRSATQRPNVNEVSGWGIN